MPAFEDWIDPIPPHLLSEVLADLHEACEGKGGDDPFDPHFAAADELAAPLVGPRSNGRSGGGMGGSPSPPPRDELLSADALASAASADNQHHHAARPSYPGARQSMLSIGDFSTQFGGGSVHGSTGDRFSEGSAHVAGGGRGPLPPDFARVRRTDPGAGSAWASDGSGVSSGAGGGMGEIARLGAASGSTRASVMHESKFGGTLLLSPGQGAHVHTGDSSGAGGVGVGSMGGGVGIGSRRRHPHADSEAHQLRRRRRQYRRRSAVAAAVARASTRLTAAASRSHQPLGASGVAPSGGVDGASNQRMAVQMAALLATATSPEVDWTGVAIAAASGFFLGVQVCEKRANGLQSS